LKGFKCYTGRDNGNWIAQVKGWLSRQEHQTFIVKVDPVKSKRSDAQNRFYWGVLLPALVEYGSSYGAGQFEEWNSEDYHEVLKEKYLRGQSEKTGRIITRSTTSLNIKEFSEYLEKIIDHILVKTFNGVIMDRDKEIYREAMGLK
jgi:hypothetical protein